MKKKIKAWAVVYKDRFRENKWSQPMFVSLERFAAEKEKREHEMLGLTIKVIPIEIKVVSPKKKISNK